MSATLQAPDIGELRRQIWPLLKRYAARRWPAMIVVLITLAARAALEIVQPWPMKLLADYILVDAEMPGWLRTLSSWLPGPGDTDGLLTWIVASTVLIFIAAKVVRFANGLAGVAFGVRMKFDLASDLFAHLQRLGLRYHASRTVGDSLVRVTRDTDCVSTLVSGALLPAGTAVLTLVGMFAVMWVISPALTLAAVAAVPIMLAALKLTARTMDERAYAVQEAEGRSWAQVEQSLGAVPAIQAFGAERAAQASLHKTLDVAMGRQIKLVQAQLSFNVLVGLATALGTGLVTFFAARQVLDNTLTVGDLLLFLSYLASLYTPLTTIAYSGSTIAAATGSARRVLEVLRLEPDIVDQPGAKSIDRAVGQIEVDGVSFGYIPNRPILKNVSFTVEPGQTVGIVGTTGSGKSTLISLLLRLFDPDEGVVRLDGDDIRSLRLADLRGQASLVRQEPFLFPASFADNIAYGRPGASRASIESTAEAAGAADFIRRSPDGFDTVVGERGGTLSVGQRQRVEIARALLRDAPILILDEPTSALDAVTEAHISQSLQRLARSRTTFIIAHRLSTIQAADMILVLEQGEIREQGNHADLLAKNGIYAGMWRSQFGEREPHQELN